MRAHLTIGAPKVCAGEEKLEKLPRFILAGLKAYSEAGAQAALTEWLKGSAMESDEDAAGLAGLFSELEIRYGGYCGYHVIGNEAVSPNTQVVFLQLDYELGPVFSRFLCYRPRREWIAAGRFDFNTDPYQILPEPFLKK